MSCCKCATCANKVRDSTNEDNGIEINVSQQVTNTTSDILEVGLLKMPKPLYLAIGILNGRYGNGEERKETLGKDYDDAQKAVNAIAYLYE